MPWIDRGLWVQSDLKEAERRGIARDGGTKEARDSGTSRRSRRLIFCNGNDLGERATVIVNGTPTQPYDQNTETWIAPVLH